MIFMGELLVSGRFNSIPHFRLPIHDTTSESSFIFLAAAVRRTSSLSKMPSARVSGEVRVKFPLKALCLRVGCGSFELGDVEGG